MTIIPEDLECDHLASIKSNAGNKIVLLVLRFDLVDQSDRSLLGFLVVSFLDYLGQIFLTFLLGSFHLALQQKLFLIQQQTLGHSDFLHAFGQFSSLARPLLAERRTVLLSSKLFALVLLKGLAWFSCTST
jgi:hypothetical protein